MKYSILVSILFSATHAAFTSITSTTDDTLNPGTTPLTPQPATAALGAVTVTVLPTQVVVGNATLTRNAPGTSVGDTPVSLGYTALYIGTSTIPFPTSGLAPLYTIAGQIAAAGPAGVAIAGSTISNNGPGVTVSGTPISLGSYGLVIGGTTTFAIPTVEPLQSVFAVGSQSITEKYGRIVFSSTQAVANISVEATGATVGPKPTGSNQPFVGAAVKTKGLSKVALAVLGAFALVIS